MSTNPRELARQMYRAASGEDPTTETLDRVADEVLALLRDEGDAPDPQDLADARLGERAPVTSPLDAPEGIPVVDEYTTTSEVFPQAIEWDVTGDESDFAALPPGLEAAPGVSWSDVEEALVGFGQSAETARFLEKLRAIAAAASAGPWRREDDAIVRTADDDGSHRGPPRSETIARLAQIDSVQAECDAAFLTTFDPSMVLALLFLNRQLELENARLRRGQNATSTVDVDPSAPSS